MPGSAILPELSFWLFAGLMILGALGVLFHRSIVYSALLLLVTFLSIAGVFVLLNAPFIAVAQILVYGVGLTIVLIFGIMLTGDQPIKNTTGPKQSKTFWLVSAITAGGFIGFLLWAILSPNAQFTTLNGLFSPQVDFNALVPGLEAVKQDGGVEMIAKLLFSQYLLPFELSSVLLLLAMMGAIILSKRILPEEENEIPLDCDTTTTHDEFADLSKRAAQMGVKETIGAH